MTRFGYTMMCEQARPDQLVRDVALAEQAGFDFSVISDHYAPWLEEQGHAGYAWSILGAAAQATESIPLMTYVTCPTLRYHPAVVAQKAATVQILSDGRFRLGLGAGENLNEHVAGARWPRGRRAPRAVERGGRDHRRAARRGDASTTAASTATSTPPTSTTATTSDRRSGSPSADRTRARSPAAAPT